MIAIDPGESAGFAIFDEGALTACGIIDDDTWTHVGCWERVVWEHPTIYPGSKNPNNIVTLAVTAGRLVERATNIAHGVEKWYLPRQWKGQIPKTKKAADYIIFKRLIQRLTRQEGGVMLAAIRDLSEKASLDVIDAVGIGVFDALGGRVCL